MTSLMPALKMVSGISRRRHQWAKGWKRWVYFDLLPQKIQNLTEISPDGGHFGRDSIPEGNFSAGDLAADVPAKLHPPEGFRQQIDGVGMGDGPVEVAEDGHPTGFGTGVIHEIPADPRQGVRGADRGRPRVRKMGQPPRSGLRTAETNEIILQVGPGAQQKTFSSAERQEMLIAFFGHSSIHTIAARN